MPHTCTKMNTTSRLHTLIIYTWWTRMNKTSPLVSGVKVLSKYAISISFYTMINWIYFLIPGNQTNENSPLFRIFQRYPRQSYLAYCLVQSRAVWSCFSLSFKYCWAMWPTSGLAGLQSSIRQQIDSSNLEMVREGVQASFKVSIQILPLLLLLMLQW